MIPLILVSSVTHDINMKGQYTSECHFLRNMYKLSMFQPFNSQKNYYLPFGKNMKYIQKHLLEHFFTIFIISTCIFLRKFVLLIFICIYDYKFLEENSNFSIVSLWSHIT